LGEQPKPDLFIVGVLNPFLLPLILINLTGHMALSGGRLSGSLYILKVGDSEALMGLFMALFSLMPVITSLPVGRWVDRVGVAPIMRWGIGLVVLGIMLPIFYLTVGSLLVMATAIGLGFNMVAVSAQHAVGHIAPQATQSERMANFGWYALGHSTSSTIGPLLAGFLIDFAGYREAFIALAIMTGISALIVAFKANQLPGAKTIQQQAADKQAKHEAAQQQTNPSKSSALDLLATKKMRRIYLTNMMTAAAWDLFIVSLPVLGHRMGYSASVIGTVMSMFALGTFTARAAMPWLAKRFNEWQILATALWVVSVCFLVMPWANLAVLLMAVGYCFGAAVGMSQPNILSLLHTAAPPGRGGEAVGLRSVLSNGVSVVVPLGFGALVAVTGIPALLLTGAVVFGLGSMPAVKANRDGSQTRTDAAN
jgi:MFS family permease